MLMVVALAQKKPPPNPGELSIEFPYSDTAIKALESRPRFDKIFISGKQPMSVRDARMFRSFPEVEFLQIWCGITRAGLREALVCPGLKRLSLFELKQGGRLEGLDKVTGLEELHCSFNLTANDLREIARLPGLHSLGAQGSTLTTTALESLLDANSLRKLDLESSNFNDEYARLISQSKQITSLEIGVTRISRVGLEAICQMTQLKELDLWSTRVREDDLDMLAALKHLEYLSVGGHDDQTEFTPEGTFPKLEKIPSLKRVWLDGFRVTRDEWDYLNARYEEVKVTSVGD